MSVPATMKAIVALVIKDIPTPIPTHHVLIHVKAFGISHAEMHMHRGEWAEAAPVSGIECVGVVAACPGGEFAPGMPVAALMCGLGRTINGSYAEYTLAPARNVVQITSDLPWAELTALPESYATAWSALFRNLELQRGETLLIRGATSALGQAALNLAVNAGVSVIATSRNGAQFEQLLDKGVARAVLEGPDLAPCLADTTVDKVLILVGNSVLLDSLAIPRRGGRVCLVGFLGRLAPLPDFDPLSQMASGVHFSFFGSFVFGTPQFPLADVLLQAIAVDVATGVFDAKPAGVFRLEDIREAHRTMEENKTGG